MAGEHAGIDVGDQASAAVKKTAQIRIRCVEDSLTGLSTEGLLAIVWLGQLLHPRPIIFTHQFTTFHRTFIVVDIVHLMFLIINHILHQISMVN